MALSTPALQGSPPQINVIGSQKLGIFTFNLGTYATNGVAFTPANFGLVRIDFLLVPSTSGYVFQTDYTNSKIKAFDQKDPADTGGADIALPEVANSTNLASVSIRALVIGV